MALVDSIPGVSGFVSGIKEVIFGEKNSRIDAVLDYFFSVRQEKRAKIILYTFVGLFFVLILIIFLYFWGLHNLQTKLDDAAYNVKELNNLQASYMTVNKEFSELTSNLQRNNQYSTIVSALVQKTKDLGLETSTISEKPALIELQNTDPLFGQFQKILIDYKIPNISLRKIIDYVNTIQQMENRFKVTKLEIQQKFGTKLYFDLSLTIEAYVPQQKNPDK